MRSAILFLAVLLLAAVLRAPYLQDIPRLTDETAEVADALAIVVDGERPLVAGDAYRGPLWAYLLAGALRLRFEPDTPRQLAWLLGVATVAAAFLLGHAVGQARTGRTGTALAGRFGAESSAPVLIGGAAALWTATSFSLITLNSHVAWSNNSTPLWLLLGLWALVRAARPAGDARGLGHGAIAREGRGTILPRAGSAPGRGGARRSLGRRWMALAGLFWGLALHSHPSALLPALGAVAWALAEPARRRSSGLWIGAAVGLAVLSPIVVHNVIDPGSSVTDAAKSDQPLVRQYDPATLAGNAADMLGQIGRAAAAGPLKEPGDPGPPGVVRVADALRPFTTALYAAAILTGLVLATIRGPRVVGAAGLAGLALLPLINSSYIGFYDTRYVAFLIPLGYIGLATALSDGWQASQGIPGSRRGSVGWVRPVSIGVVVLLAALPLIGVAAYYERELAAGRTNIDLRRQAAVLSAEARTSRAGGPADHHVLIDKALRPLKTGGGGNVARAMDHLLTLHGVTHSVVDASEIRWFLTQTTATTFWAVAGPTVAAETQAEGQMDLVDTGNVGPGTDWQLLRTE